MGWEVQETHPATWLQTWALSQCAVSQGNTLCFLSVMEEEAAQRGPQAVRSRATARISGLKFHGWVICPTPMMSSHCVTLSGPVSPSDPSGHPFRWLWSCSTPVRQLGNWRGCVVVGSWGGVGRKCLPCPRLFSNRIWAWPRGFQTEVSVGGQNLAGRSRELLNPALFIYCLFPFGEPCVCVCVLGSQRQGELCPSLWPG